MAQQQCRSRETYSVALQRPRNSGLADPCCLRGGGSDPAATAARLQLALGCRHGQGASRAPLISAVRGRGHAVDQL